MLLSPPEQEPRNLIQSVFSLDDRVMLAALICLLLVIFFVLLLHIYAKWFLSQSRSRRRTPVVPVSQILGPTRFRRFDPFPFDTDYPTKGLDSSVIASIPLFVYESDQNQDLECVICLTVFKGGELGRKLPKCWHGFHVECIDMWLGSHSSCPICRAPAVSEVGEIDSVSNADVVSDFVNEESALQIVVEVPNADRNSEDAGRSGGDSSSASSLSSQAAAIDIIVMENIIIYGCSDSDLEYTVDLLRKTMFALLYVRNKRITGFVFKVLKRRHVQGKGLEEKMVKVLKAK